MTPIELEGSQRNTILRNLLLHRREKELARIQDLRKEQDGDALSDPRDTLEDARASEDLRHTQISLPGPRISCQRSMRRSSGSTPTRMESARNARARSISRASGQCRSPSSAPTASDSSMLDKLAVAERSAEQLVTNSWPIGPFPRGWSSGSDRKNRSRCPRRTHQRSPARRSFRHPQRPNGQSGRVFSDRVSEASAANDSSDCDQVIGVGILRTRAHVDQVRRLWSEYPRGRHLDDEKDRCRTFSTSLFLASSDPRVR